MAKKSIHHPLSSLIIALRATLIVLVGLHLVLPSCLCQVLAVLGLSPDPQPDHLQHQIQAVSDISNDAILPCHCDEPNPKNAEIPRETSLPTGVPVTDIVDHADHVPLLGTRSLTRSSRAPPDRPIPTAPSRAWIPVYLL